VSVVVWDLPSVKEEHVMLLAWIWHELVPATHEPVTPEIAAETWAMYRACPATQHPAVLKMRRWTNELWLLYVQSN